MSIAEIDRFAADLNSNEALRAEAEKHAAESHHETPIGHCVSFAASKGYAFTAGEAKQHIKATAKATGRELTDAELDGVAGGISLLVYPSSSGSPVLDLTDRR
jgi:hypothetical protein